MTSIPAHSRQWKQRGAMTTVAEAGAGEQGTRRTGEDERHGLTGNSMDADAALWLPAQVREEGPNNITRGTPASFPQAQGTYRETCCLFSAQLHSRSALAPTYQPRDNLVLTTVKMSQINTLLFDCDNTLVLSEELAFEACADLINQICEGRQLEARFTGDTLIKEFVGQNFRGMLVSLQKLHAIEISPEDLEIYVKKEEDAVIAKLKEALKPCPGVDEQLEKLAASKKYLMSVVSSSALRRVKASIEKVGQDKYFPGDVVFSAATSLDPPTSKPDPAIYLHAMKKLGKKPEECVAIEDSKSGTLSATRAGIKVVGYVGPYADDKKDEMAQVLTDAGAVVMMRDWAEFPALLEKIESGKA
ncbi:hypothetical protein G7046_g10098 [Stylonectria norvegica]|nr:hypothetical protein G7046_g10098 [Stylonectria norvegica]